MNDTLTKPSNFRVRDFQTDPAEKLIVNTSKEDTSSGRIVTLWQQTPSKWALSNSTNNSVAWMIPHESIVLGVDIIADSTICYNIKR